MEETSSSTVEKRRIEDTREDMFTNYTGQEVDINETIYPAQSVQTFIQALKVV